MNLLMPERNNPDKQKEEENKARDTRTAVTHIKTHALMSEFFCVIGYFCGLFCPTHRRVRLSCQCTGSMHNYAHSAIPQCTLNDVNMAFLWCLFVEGWAAFRFTYKPMHLFVRVRLCPGIGTCSYMRVTTVHWNSISLHNTVRVESLTGHTV